MNQDSQKQFVSWLAQKLGAKDEQDLKSKMQQMGNDGIKQAYQAFMQEQNQQVQMQEQGGKLEYLRCLQAFKKGGAVKMAECGCGGAIPKDAKGGSMMANKGYSRSDSSTPAWTTAANKRDDKGMAEHSQGSRKDTATMTHKKADIKDQHKKVEANPGSKDWMEKGKKTKEHTALTKVPKGKEGMATPAQQKMIALKKKDAAKDRMSKAMQGGGTMTGMVPQPKHKNKQAKPGLQAMM